MEIWVLENASEKLELLKNIGEKSEGVLLGHKRGEAFIVEEILPLFNLDLKSPENILNFLTSKTELIGFFSLKDEMVEIPQFLFGNILLRIQDKKIKGYFIDLNHQNSVLLAEIPVLLLKGGKYE